MKAAGLLYVILYISGYVLGELHLSPAHEAHDAVLDELPDFTFIDCRCPVVAHEMLRMVDDYEPLGRPDIIVDMSYSVRSADVIPAARKEQHGTLCPSRILNAVAAVHIETEVLVHEPVHRMKERRHVEVGVAFRRDIAENAVKALVRAVGNDAGNVLGEILLL